jgi:uncharacterized membrane protein YqjE
MTDRPTDGIVRSVRRMLAIAVSMAKTRLCLLAVEARLELNSIWLQLALTVLALILVAMSLLMLSLLVIIAYWETSRLLAIGCLLGLYVAATTATLLILRHKAKRASILFAASLSELSRDHSELADTVEDVADVAGRRGGQN